MIFYKFDFNFQKIRTYAFAYLLCVFYFFVFEYKFSIPVIVIFTIMPVISYFLILYSLDRIDLNCSISENLTTKGNVFFLNIEINAEKFKPLPFLYIDVFSDNRVKTNDKTSYLLCLFNETNITLSLKYEALVWGKSVIGIKDIYVYDFFKLFKFTITPPEVREINIAPNIIDINFSKLVNYIIAQSNSQNEEETLPFGFISNPSYDHRPYIVGDSFKRVNWKLSSKAKKMLVREVEFYSNNNIVLILDKKSSNYSTDNLKNYLCEEKTIESLLSFIEYLLKEGLHCSLMFSNNNFFDELFITSIDDLSEVQELFSSYTFDNSSNRFPDPIQNSTIILFTTKLDEELIDYENTLKNSNNLCFIVTSNENNAPSTHTWHIDENYELVQCSN